MRASVFQHVLPAQDLLYFYPSYVFLHLAKVKKHDGSSTHMSAAAQPV